MVEWNGCGLCFVYFFENSFDSGVFDDEMQVFDSVVQVIVMNFVIIFVFGYGCIFLFEMKVIVKWLFFIIESCVVCFCEMQYLLILLCGVGNCCWGCCCIFYLIFCDLIFVGFDGFIMFD